LIGTDHGLNVLDLSSEDVAAIRLGQEKYLKAMGDVEVVLSAESVEEFQKKVEDNQFSIDIVISDIGLPGKSGIEGIAWTKSKFPNTEILMVSVYTDTDNIFKALCAGAIGYLAKNTPLNELHQAIHSVLEGGSPMTPSIARKVIQHFNPSKQDPKNDLSSKEHQVVQCVVDGLSYKLIADRMGISINTVRHHIRNIYSKLQINSKAELIKKSFSGGIRSVFF
jgi:DNA-binding NarL/FixJ family response regulator